MVTSVLDASALLRFLLGEAGGDRVKAILSSAQQGQSRVVISAVNRGEVIGKIYQSQGKPSAEALTGTMQFYGLEIVPATADRAGKAAIIKADLKLPYADSFCVELAASFQNHLLMTADFDFALAAQAVTMEFLPAKPKP